MSKERLDHLLERELDGELTRIESEELERLLLAAPDARRELSGWRRFERGLRAGAEHAPRLEADRLARALCRRAAEPGPPPPEASRRRPLTAAALVIGGLLLASEAIVEPPPAPVAATATQIANVSPVEHPPVAIRIGRAEPAPSADDDLLAGDRDDLVTIRF